MGWTHDLLMDAARFHASDRAKVPVRDDLRSATLHQLDRATVHVLCRAGERALASRIELLWTGGWQPVELLRQARLAGTRATTPRLMAEAIAYDDAKRRAATLDARWIAQIEAMDLPPADGKPGWLRRWIDEERLGRAEARDVLIETLAITSLPQLDHLMSPPGTAGAPQTPRDTATDHDPLLDRIRALLAKAESTEFEEEATAFTAKAQELITRHAIDVAMLDDDASSEADPAVIRVPVDPPYADAKGLMLQIVAENTRCRAVMMSELNMSRVVGFPADLTAVEMLFTSLLIQAQTALTQAAKIAAPGTRTRSSSYRSSFFVAYANRIGDRLAEINSAVEAEVAETEGSAFLPVLHAQEDRVDAFIAERYGDSVQSTIRGGYDPAAMAHGRQAADSAQLSFGYVEADSDDASSDTPDEGHNSTTARRLTSG